LEMGADSDAPISPLDAARMRDLISQVERFLEYAPRGTSSSALKQQAEDFEAMLSRFDSGPGAGKVRGLRSRLRELSGGLGG
jgi:hypothetical protein